jgi:hypothetical protein
MFLSVALLAISSSVNSEKISENLWIDQFDHHVPPGLADPMAGPAPVGWENPQFKDGFRDYAIVKEGPDSFLRGRFIPKTSGKVIFKKVDWDLIRYPYFSWKWRVNKWATGSTVKVSKKEDSSASVYVTIRSGLRAYVIKYIWAETDTIGDGYSKGEWNPSGRLMATVIRTGGNLGEWATEKRNIVDDFQKLYGKAIPNHLVKGIGVLTEGDGTKTIPEADYDSFQVSKD